VEDADKLGNIETRKGNRNREADEKRREECGFESDSDLVPPTMIEKLRETDWAGQPHSHWPDVKPRNQTKPNVDIG
jgi:hypothetical protein